MTSPRAFLIRAIDVRKKLIESGQCQKNVANVLLALISIEPWVRAYPNASNRQIANYLWRKRKTFLVLLPNHKEYASSDLHLSFIQIIKTYADRKPAVSAAA